MDLRKYDVPENIAEILKGGGKRKTDFDYVQWYQPFIFTDDVITGAGAIWNSGANEFYCTKEDTKKMRKIFLREAIILGDWYNYINNIMLDSFPNAETFLDFGCSNGHFGFDLTRRGKIYTGIDRESQRPSYELIKRITGIEFEWIDDTYNEMTHSLKLNSTRQFDCGILSVVLMHLADPHYAMAYISKKIKKGIFFSTLVVPGHEHKFFARVRGYRINMPLPLSFELVPSEPLGESLMRFAGFQYIYKIPYRKKGNPRNTKRWRCWIASREPISDLAIIKYNLLEIPDRRETFADINKGNISLPNINSKYLNKIKRLVSRRMT